MNIKKYWRVFRKTYSGVNLNEVTHQNLSNIYWFYKILYNHIFSESIIDGLVSAYKIINEKFNGDILPYYPKFEFKEEILFLEKNGYIFWKSDIKEFGEIIYDGEIIGKVECIKYLRNKKLKDVGIFGW